MNQRIAPLLMVTLLVLCIWLPSASLCSANDTGTNRALSKDKGVVPITTGAAFPPVRISIDGPMVLATSPSQGETAKYSISVTGGPASVAANNTKVNWSYTAYLKGDYANTNNKSAPLL